MSHAHRKPDKDGWGGVGGGGGVFNAKTPTRTHSDAKSLPKKYIPFISLSFLFFLF